MNTHGMVTYTEGEFFGVKNLRRYDGLNGTIYFIGANADLEKLYDIINGRFVLGEEKYSPRYDVHPLMNMNRNYGLEIRDGKFAIVTAEKIVENLLKW